MTIATGSPIDPLLGIGLRPQRGVRGAPIVVDPRPGAQSGAIHVTRSLDSSHGPAAASIGGTTRTGGSDMRKVIVTAFALAVAIVSMLPAVCAAKLSANHNQTRLRG